LREKLQFDYSTRQANAAGANVRRPTANGARNALKTYILYIQDGRYAAPTLLTIDASDDDSALADARRHLSASQHYRAIDVFEDERLVATVSAGVR
jgi:hypothetical protein